MKGHIPDITGPLITELAREGDAMCIELLQDIGQWLGVGIANLAAALDPPASSSEAVSAPPTTF